MRLNISKGNMYEFITHTGNTIKGACPHDCSYCYMKRWGKLNPVRLDEGELKIDTESGNFIFVGSSCDIFADAIPDEWIKRTLEHCSKSNNRYMFQSKNPTRFFNFGYPERTECFCTTIETNRDYPNIMNNSPRIESRVKAMAELDGYDAYVTIEPIMDFDTDELFELIARCKPKQVNIGADSGKNNLPEPSFEKVMVLIEMLKGITTIHKKRNLDRLLTSKSIAQ